ncbi:hypothetical protein MKW92_046720 [Papaver armeniacum]|nr:hypothetical protein MKW92_046720 [Papaver armeniacum]
MLQMSFDDFQKQTTLMTNCTLLWKELSDHFTTLEQDLKKKSEAIQEKIQSLANETKETLDVLTEKEKLRLKEMLRSKLVKLKNVKRRQTIDLGWACVLLLESLIPVVADPVFGNTRPMVTPTMKKRAQKLLMFGKRTPDVHTFLQHLVTFGIVSKEDGIFYRKLVLSSAWRKQMPKLAVSLGLGDNMPDMIEELISKGQQVDAVHFTYEVGLVDKFPPVPLLKAYLNDSKKAATSLMEDPNNGKSAHLAGRKEQSALRAVIRCIEEYKLDSEFPAESLKKRLEQLEKTKVEKKSQLWSLPIREHELTTMEAPCLLPRQEDLQMLLMSLLSRPVPPHTSGHQPMFHILLGSQLTHMIIGPLVLPCTVAEAHLASETLMDILSEHSSPVMMTSPFTGPALSYPAYGGYGNGVPVYQQTYYR